MKTKLFTMNALLAGLFVLASCSSDEKAIDNPVQTTDEPNTVGTITAMATMPQAGTRIHATEGSSSLEITWNEDTDTEKDKFAILRGEGTVKAQEFIQGDWADGNGTDKHSAYFNGSITLDKVNNYYAVYPYSIASGSQTAQSITLDMTGQTGTALDKSKIYMYDKKKYTGGNEFEFVFQHLTSILKLTLQFPADVKIKGTQTKTAIGETVSNVTFVADAGLLPEATADLTGETASYTGDNGAIALSGTFTLEQDANDSENDNPCATVYLHVIPQTLSNFMVVAEVGGKLYSAKLTPEANPLIAGKVYKTTTNIEMEEGVPANVVDKVNISSCTSLKVTGDMTGGAINALQTWAKTERDLLDLSEANFVAGETFNSIDIDGVCDGTTELNVIGDGMFIGCKFKEIIIPDNITAIGEHAFEEGIFSSFTIPEGVTSLGYDAFYDCNNLTEIEIPSSVTEIGSCIFEECSGLVTVTIKGSPKELEYTFLSCSSLRNVYILGTETFTIKNSTFGCCDALELIQINASSAPTLSGTGIFDASNCKVKVPSTALQSYKDDATWQSYVTAGNIIIEAQ